MSFTWKSVLFVGLSLLLYVALRALSPSPAHTRITSQEAHRLVEQGARLVDVRTPSEFAERHIDGALNVPLQVLESQSALLGPKDGAIVLYCRSGHRSGLAVEQLKRKGYTKLYDLGPMTAY